MANLALPGFTPARRHGGGRITYRKTRVLSNNTNSINLNDAVIFDTNGNTIHSTATTTAVGSIAQGVSYVDASGVRKGDKALPAATTYTSSGNWPDNASYCFVVDDSINVDYMASITTALTLAALYANTSFVDNTTPSNGISGQTLDSSGINTTATLPFRLYEFVIAGDSDPDAANAHVYCRINASNQDVNPPIAGSLGL